MKIALEDYIMLQTALFDTLKAHNLHPYMVSNTKQAWEVFNRAGSTNRLNINQWYKKYNDAQTQTALIRIFKNVRAGKTKEHSNMSFTNLSPSVASVLRKIERRTKLKPKPDKIDTAAKRRNTVDPNVRTLLHSKNALDRVQGALDQVFGSGMVIATDPKRAYRETTKGGDNIFHEIYEAQLPQSIDAEQLLELTQAFAKYRTGVAIRSLQAVNNALVLTVMSD